MRVDANRSLARRRPSIANDQAVKPTTNSSAAVQNVVPQPVQSNSARRAIAAATAAAPAPYGAQRGSLAPINAEGCARLVAAPSTVVVMAASGSRLAEARPAIS